MLFKKLISPVYVRITYICIMHYVLSRVIFMAAEDVSNGEWCGDIRRGPYGCTSTLIASLFCESNRQKAGKMKVWGY